MGNGEHSLLYQSQKKIFIALLIVGAIFVGKLAGAFITNSLALFSDSWHLATDIASLIISWWGLKQAAKPATHKHTFGHYRHGILAALINNLSLILISLFILYSAVQRYLNPVAVEPKGMIVFAILGLAANSMILLFLRGNRNNMNVKSAFLHFLGDALADVGVLLGGIIIYFTGWMGIDTLLSAILACLILRSAVKMSLECISIFLEAAPKGINPKEVKDNIVALPGVEDVRDLHVWSLSNEVLSMTAHVSVVETDLVKCEELLHEIQHLLHDRFNINHSTVQFEHIPCSSCYHSKKDHITHCLMCIDSGWR